MRYIVIADHGAYTAGQVIDLGDAEAASTLIRTTGVSMLPLSGAATPAAVKPKAKPAPAAVAKLEPVPVQPAPAPKPEPKVAPPVVAKTAPPMAMGNKTKPASVKGK